ncbi:MAG: S46 family peptidase [Alphaproteobacteria bacterium]
MIRFASAMCALIFCTFSAAAEEGMWTFEHFPAAKMQAELGWAPDAAWLDRVAAGSARVEGICSAASVSAQGLVLTNHHCVRDCVQDLSTPSANYIADGFTARALSEERRCAGMAVQLLLSATDVTQQIDAATANATPPTFAAARNAAVDRIQRICAGDDPGKRCEVVALYQGARYELDTYRRFEDVRLVFAPEAAMAHFGGDADNFNFPRYALDFAFIRLYEHGAPAATPQHLQLRFTPLQSGEIVLVSGNPGPTSRFMTAAQIAFQRDVFLPWRIASLTDLRARLGAYAAAGPDQARAAADQILSVENSLKSLSGWRDELSNAAFFAQIEAHEADLRTRVRRDRAAQQDVGDAWGEIVRAQASYRSFFMAHQYLEIRAGGGSRLFNWARDIVRGAAEREKPEAQRLPRYAQARLGAVEQSVLADRPVDPGMEEVLFGFWAVKLRQYLTADDPLTNRVLGGESPEALAHRLISGTQLADPAVRAALWRGGASAVAASTDPLVVFVRNWDANARDVQALYQQAVEFPTGRASERIAQARFRAFGETLYPDSSFTPRVSYGRVAGWVEPVKHDVAPLTNFGGLYRRATGAEPFKLSSRWSAAQNALDSTTLLDVSSSNDIIGGNSGSPLLDREGRVVGVVFDGNSHSLGGEYFYDPDVNRAVSVTSTAIRSALAQVYGMDALVAELEAP